jgi:nicotinamide-nucleotide amidase
VRLRLSGRGHHAHELENDLQLAAQGIRDILGHHVYGEQELALEEAIGRQLLAKNQQLALAESCTGGHIAQLITAIPGCSAYFKGGVVSYSNESKMQLLGVRAETLAQYGAVSEETVREMAEGARQRFASTYAIAVSGIAGPGGGTEEKPVGTVWIAVAGPDQIQARMYQLGEERSLNIERAAMQSLYLLWKMLVTN